MKRKIDKFINDFFSNHKGIEHIYFGNDADYSSIANKRYRSVQIEFLQVNPTVYKRTYSYAIAISDLKTINTGEISTDLYMQNQISDCIEIMEDFFDFLNWQLTTDLTFSPQFEYTIIPFDDEGGDRTVGVVANIQLVMQKNSNTCFIPLKN